MNKQEILLLAQKYKWAFNVLNEPNPLMLSFFKFGMRMNVYYTTGTVSTAIDHPKAGRTQLYRRDITIAQLEKLFINPREHTGKGYFKRGNG